MAVRSKKILKRLASKNKSDSKNKKSVYFFGNGKAEGRGSMKNLLGGKGANLAEMTNLKIPVPAGFTITTSESLRYNELGKKFNSGLKKSVTTGAGIRHGRRSTRRRLSAIGQSGRAAAAILCAARARS